MERWKSSVHPACAALGWARDWSMVSAMQWIWVLWFEVSLLGNYGCPHLLAMGVNCWADAIRDTMRLMGDNGGRMCYMEALQNGMENILRTFVLNSNILFILVAESH